MILKKNNEANVRGKWNLTLRFGKSELSARVCLQIFLLDAGISFCLAICTTVRLPVCLLAIIFAKIIFFRFAVRLVEAVLANITSCRCVCHDITDHLSYPTTFFVCGVDSDFTVTVSVDSFIIACYSILLCDVFVLAHFDGRQPTTFDVSLEKQNTFATYKLALAVIFDRHLRFHHNRKT